MVLQLVILNEMVLQLVILNEMVLQLVILNEMGCYWIVYVFGKTCVRLLVESRIKHPFAVSICLDSNSMHKRIDFFFKSLRWFFTITS